MRDEVDAPGLEDDDGGKAKSEDEVGRYGREEAFGMSTTGSSSSHFLLWPY